MVLGGLTLESYLPGSPDRPTRQRLLRGQQRLEADLPAWKPTGPCFGMLAAIQVAGSDEPGVAPTGSIVASARDNRLDG